MITKMFSKLESAQNFLNNIDKILFVKYEVGSFLNSKEELEDKFYTHYSANIFLEDSNPDSDKREEIGVMSFTRLSFSHQVSGDKFWIFDANNLYSRLYDRLYDEEHEKWLIEEIEETANNFWLMDDVCLKEEYRGKGLVQLIMLDKMKRFFSFNDLIFAFSYPLQFDTNFKNLTNSQYWKTDETISFNDAQEKLKKSYKNVGYKYLEDYKIKKFDDLKLKSRIKNEQIEDNKLIYFIYEGLPLCKYLEI